MTVAQELKEVLAAAPKSHETPHQYAERLARKANDLEDDDWAVFGNTTQIWVNAALEAIERGQEVPLPEGIEGAMSDSPVNGEVAALPKASKTKKVKQPKQPKQPKGEASATGAKRGPKGSFGPNDKIEILVSSNPFRPGTKCAAWFEKLRGGETVENNILNGVPRHHIRWERTLGYIKIG